MGKVAASTAPAALTTILHFFALNLEQLTAGDIELRLCSGEREDKYLSRGDLCDIAALKYRFRKLTE